MDKLYDYDTVYKIDTLQSSEITNDHKYMVFGKSSDFDSEGIGKLTEILKAIGWKENENCSIIGFEENQSISIAQYLSSNNCKAIAFGMTEKELGLQAVLPLYTLANFENAVVVRSQSISALKDDKQMKINLWNSIKSFKE